MDRRDLGRKGEYLARLYLEQKGLEFIRANYLTPRGEIDLIMRENDEIVFLEVKTRTVESARRYGRGALRIDKGKQRSMYYAASQFMREEKKAGPRSCAPFRRPGDLPGREGTGKGACALYPLRFRHIKKEGQASLPVSGPCCERSRRSYPSLVGR